MAFLSRRLETALELVPRCDVAADVGSDHGKMAVALLQSGKCERVIATDASEGSYEKLRAMVKAADLTKRVDCRLGDGLTVLREGEAECAVIAGMGGRLIADILEAERAMALGMTLVLVPMQQTDGLRAYIRQNGFYIEEETMVYENHKFYAILRVVAGRESDYIPAQIYDEVGPRLFARRDPLALRRIRHKLFSLQGKLLEEVDQEELKAQITLLKLIEKEWGDEP